MFNVSEESGAARLPMSYPDRAKLTCPATDFTPGTRTVTGIDVRSLPAGTEILVGTCNSHYRFVMRDDGGRNVSVEGGRYFPEATTARIDGSTLRGSLIRIGWIGLELSVELSFGGRRIVTSRVRSIRVLEGNHDEQSSRL